MKVGGLVKGWVFDGGNLLRFQVIDTQNEFRFQSGVHDIYIYVYA